METGAPEENKSFFSLITEFILIPFDKSLIQTFPEIGHLSPIILTAGALFLSVVTLNYPLAVFAGSAMEASLIYRLMSPMANYIATPESARTNSPDSERCESYFQTLTASRFKGLIGEGLVQPFPNYPLYYIVFAVTYCIQGLLAFSNECSEMGPSYSNRPYLSILGGTMFIVLYALYLLKYGCDNLFNLILTVFIAAVVGYLISYQNIALFGKTSVDLLFIPPLVKRSGMDYICVTTKTT